ncbi:MAG: HD domain-containing phosphohydrolase [Spirochaetaceae bacterium]
MTTLDTSVRRQLRGLVLLAGLAAVALVVFVVIEYTNRIEARELRSYLVAVNRAVAALIEYRIAPGSPGMPEIVEASQGVLDAIPRVWMDEATVTALRNPEGIIEQMGPEAFRSMVVEPARRINLEYIRRQELQSLFYGLSIGALLLLIGALFAAVVRVHRSYRRLAVNAGNLMRQVSRLLLYETEELDYEPEWQEEEELFLAAGAIAEEIREDRETSGRFVYGNLESFMPKLKSRLERTIPCDRLAVAFVDGQGDVVAESAAISGSVVHLEPGFREALKNTSLGRLSREGRPRIINDLEAHFRDTHQSEGTELVLKEGMRSSLTFPITIRDRCVGFLFISSREKDAYDERHISRGVRIINLLKQHLYFHYLIQQIVASTAKAFVKLMERKDNETSLHITRMSRYSYAIGRRLADRDPRVTPTMLREILWFAPLHDIGKIGIPDAVLLKPGKLDPEERRVIEGHVPIGVEVVETMDRDLDRIIHISLLRTALDIISGHHEKFDGTGYPAGLAGEDIPIAGRITAVADVFDALTSRRPYKDAMSVETALEIMREGRGSHFDPKVFDAFLDALQEIREVYEENKEV